MNNDDHIISDREKRAWQASKKKAVRERPILNLAQRIIFLNLMARMAPNSEFERSLGLNRNDIQYYCKLLNVESPDEARQVVKKLKQESIEQREAKIISETKRVREAEEVAQQRLDELANKRLERPVKTIDVNAIKNDDAERQRRFASQQSEASIPKKEWRLPLEGSVSQRQETIDRFRREIVYHGFSFIFKKYGASRIQTKHEANRLGLKIKWDSVRR